MPEEDSYQFCREQNSYESIRHELECNQQKVQNLSGTKNF